MNMTQAARPRFGWYGDDFTGATDTLATWAEHGYRALLFLHAPTAVQLAAAGPLDAIGLAGATRAMSPTAAKIELDKAGCLFAALEVELLHYKCCSTFDSAPDVGSIGIAVQTLRRYFPNALLPIIGGQPNLGRYCLFGHLFAAARTGGAVHRIDRHPTMSVHPVTPMGEADLRRHLAAQGLERVATLDYRAYHGVETSALLDACLAEKPEAVLFDVAAENDLTVIGRLIADRIADGPMLAVGPSSVARALVAASAMHPTATPASDTSSRRDGAVLALVGSLSPVTRAQVEAATDYQRIDIDPVRLLTEFGHLQSLRRQAETLLATGNVMLVTSAAQAPPAQMERVAAATGMLLSAVLSETEVSRVVVAGGDTSSHAVAALDIWGLSYRATMVPGAPLCRVHSDDQRLDGLDIILKGGQMGPPSFFADAARR